MVVGGGWRTVGRSRPRRSGRERCVNAPWGARMGSGGGGGGGGRGHGAPTKEGGGGDATSQPSVRRDGTGATVPAQRSVSRMTHVTSNAPDGTPNWLDIGVPDLERAKTFYGTLFGWQYEDTGPEGGHYNLCTLRGEPVAGMMRNPEDQPTVYWWSVYFAAVDCDGLVKRVTDAGGEIVSPAMDVMDQGRMAIVRDPQGGQFGLWQGRTHPGSRIVNDPGSFVWNELVTRDS